MQKECMQLSWRKATTTGLPHIYLAQGTSKPTRSLAMKLNPATKSEQPARGPSPRGLLGGDLERSRLGDGLRLYRARGGLV